MQTRRFDPLGVEITGMRLPDIAAGEVEQLRDLLAAHGVAVWRNQPLDDEGFTSFLRRFGPLAFTPGEVALSGLPDLNEVSNVGRAVPPRSNFHVDTSYVDHPPAYTALRAVQVPAEGGHTLFTDQYRALESLPQTLRRRVAGRRMTHAVTGLDVPNGAQTSAEHPLERPHPRTGRVALYLTAPARCAAITGMDDAEVRQTVAALLEHSTCADNVYRHAWAPGDVVMWDNACVLHRADHDGVVGDRVLHRGMVACHHDEAKP